MHRLCLFLHLLPLLLTTPTDVSPAKAKPSTLEILPHPRAAADTLAGIWAVKGTDADGAAYAGMAIITKRESTYLVRWLSESSSGVVLGVGQRDGDTFAVAWILQRDGKSVVGSTLYTVGGDGKTLRGSWVTLPGTGKRNAETMTWHAELP